MWLGLLGVFIVIVFLVSLEDWFLRVAESALTLLGRILRLERKRTE